MRNKILSLLVLLLTAASGAWAQETPLVTIESKDYTSFTSGSMTFDDKVTVTFSNPVLNGGDEDGWEIHDVEATPVTLTVTAAEGSGYTITSVKFTTYDDHSPLTDTEFPFVATLYGESYYPKTTISDQANGIWGGVNKIEVYGTAAGPVVTWNASTNSGTFSMPGSDVVLTPLYAPTAKWDVVETVEQKPAAIEGIIAGEDKAIVTAGQSSQGTVMYAVTTTAEAAPALTAFSATVPTAKDYDDATTLYVWYYIQGHDTPDGQQATEENTFNDSEISATPLKVDILTNKFDLTFKPAPVKNMTVTVAGQAKTPTDEGKLTGVKMESEVKLKAATGYKFRKVEVKKAEKTITIGTQNYTVLDGETWKQFITRNQLSGWIVAQYTDTTWYVYKNKPSYKLRVKSDGINWETLYLTSEDAPIDTDKQYTLGYD